ncbi:H(+)-transporting ATPase [Candidatus Saccharibacteria bacterium CG11_big_fil_rev_8_21_14_0_20_41_19]|nr:ATP synthase F0 subunit C [Candidatus Saccharibacteria bacterium]OIP85827.1 MAG: H(+)-transporting ATPase [Candidatus Saccharibacteria bacterium CG2_30_41_52]PIQ70944.1 MAG: H(+)-transporting ATPase [Candidatus Saccharibacteria bacterium CG11_big_fil_rev_8_21_14_0_20_41_19]PIZ60746.1 MAG: H(+)-transporting ATPase [Candidatus Saccharibacteria bacterium CG_4_10_14_0_2_um_filter_41_11]PJC29401.1 MAG: H(+)-transporting ATPase [Candidatus Saccharibacteria bacterium CG_4_9_14_0_2_um_filter_41_9]P
MDRLAFSLAYAIPAMGAAIAIGLIGASGLSALGRNPEKVSDIRALMITAIVFCDSLAIIGMIVAIIGKVL